MTSSAVNATAGATPAPVDLSSLLNLESSLHSEGDDP